MKATTILGLGLIGFVLLALLTIVLAGGWIEDDLAERGRDELQNVGQSWATLELSGRDATIGGEAPDADATSQAMEAVANIWGIRVVEDRTTQP